MDTPPVTVTVRVNGRPRAVAPGATVADLLRQLGLPASAVAVERNREVVPRSRHGDVCLADGDAVEVVHFVGGG